MAAGELQALLESGRYLAALRQAGVIAQDAGASHQDRLQAALVAAEAAVCLGQYAEAREFALQAQELANDPEQKAHALHALGAALVYYDPADAEGVLLAALAQTAPQYLARRRPAILHNLALTYERRRDPMAITVYQQAAEAYLAQGRPGRAVGPYQNGAWLALLAGQLEEARVLLDRAAAHLEEVTPGERSHHEALESYALLLAGDRHNAALRAEDLLQPGREDTTPWAVTLAAVVAAEAALAEGLTTFAAGMVKWATERVTAARCNKLTNLLSDLRGRVEGGETA